MIKRRSDIYRMKTYEEQKNFIAAYQLTSDVFAGKVFEDLYYNLEYLTDDLRINELLKYFVHSEPDYETRNFPRIVERVRYFKVKKEGVAVMCDITDRIRREGKEEGRKEGRAIGRIEGKVEDILELLGDFGNIPQCIVKNICKESNPEKLNRWLRCAARASSMEEFETEF